MPTVLLLYASAHGHTSKIAARIASTLEADGIGVDLRRATPDGGDDPAPHDYDAVIVGASIHAGHHQKEIVDWARRHRTTLALHPSAFFSVCLTAADDTEESRHATRRYHDELVEATGWTPDRAVTFAGALQYREYDFATRLVIRLMMAKGGHPTDTSHDHDFTDWDAVERFAHECAAALAIATA
jgi:menaquinone-dependent protoporphyrinogen oxidase